VRAVKRRFPKPCCSGGPRAPPTPCRRYKKTLPSFNDDIEGTAAVAVSGMLAAAHFRRPPARAAWLVVLGAGAARVGIGR
jgi:malic enzyme